MGQKGTLLWKLAFNLEGVSVCINNRTICNYYPLAECELAVRLVL
jgi:hypothetical protein